MELAARGVFQRRNFALAHAAAEAFRGSLDPQAVAAAAAEVIVPGRLQVIDADPLTLLDGAHNPEGMAALADSLPDFLGPGEPKLTAVLSILDDKDAAGMLRTILPLCRELVLTSSHNPRALPPGTLQSLAAQLAGPGGPSSEIVPDPRTAVARARELAGPDGAVLVAGSLYLVADLLRPADMTQASAL